MIIESYFYYFLLKNDRIFATIVITSVLLDIAKFLPKALPPIVSDEIKDVTIKEIINGLMFVFVDNNATIVTPAAPEIIPQISPTTSQHTLDTFEAFFTNLTPILPPRTLLALIEWKTTSSPLVADTPIISKMIPNKIKRKVTMIETVKVTFSKTVVTTSDITSDKIKAKIVTISTHL